MANVNRLMTTICSNDLLESKRFFTSLFNFRIDYESDWFVHLVSEGRGLELGIIDREHELIPEPWQAPAAGSYITFVVDDVDELFDKAKLLGFDIVQAPSATSYGQRRALLREPSGALIDISSPMSS